CCNWRMLFIHVRSPMKSRKFLWKQGSAPQIELISPFHPPTVVFQIGRYSRVLLHSEHSLDRRGLRQWISQWTGQGRFRPFGGTWLCQSDKTSRKCVPALLEKCQYRYR